MVGECEAEIDSLSLAGAAVGCLLGMAVGDALGLPCEGLSRRRQARMYPELRHRLVLGRGMVSDDTEHACMTAQAVIASGGDPERFVRSLAWRLRFWLLGLPAGTGLATARAILKLWCGASWQTSGVYSAGNGPAMRSAILGVLYSREPLICRELVRRCTLLTHRDPKAFFGAMAVAIASREAFLMRGGVRAHGFLASLEVELGDGAEEFLTLVRDVVTSVESGTATEDFARASGLEKGVSGYIYHTIPIVIHAWLSHPVDYGSAVSAVIRCGGDTDTTAAIVGGIVAAGTGIGGIPPAWVGGVAEWPCGVPWIRQVALRSAEVAARGHGGRPSGFNLPGLLVRNLFFLGVVLFHGFRRLFPPY